MIFFLNSYPIYFNLPLPFLSPILFPFEYNIETKCMRKPIKIHVFMKKQILNIYCINIILYAILCVYNFYVIL